MAVKGKCKVPAILSGAPGAKWRKCSSDVVARPSFSSMVAAIPDREDDEEEELFESEDDVNSRSFLFPIPIWAVDANLQWE
uniref:Uncharacterized protein n=1 Tax=Oryza nivara TaxID=4536 RepID=A0A0E0HYA1_ORYNI